MFYSVCDGHTHNVIMILLLSFPSPSVCLASASVVMMVSFPRKEGKGSGSTPPQGLVLAWMGPTQALALVLSPFEQRSKIYTALPLDPLSFFH